MSEALHRIGLTAVACVTGAILAACSTSTFSSPSPSPTPTGSSARQDARTVTLQSLKPSDAQKMNSAEARRWLEKWTQQTNTGELRDAEGRWVPQVSSKCTGLDVDIKGGDADGTIDTYSVTAPQILAFHLSLRDKFSAVNTEWSSLSAKATTGPCSGKNVWIAFIPRAYPSAGAALDVCDTDGFPYGECAARYVPRDKSETTQMVLPVDPGDDRSQTPTKEPQPTPSDGGEDVPQDEDPAVRLGSVEDQVNVMFGNIRAKEVFCNSWLRNPDGAWDLMAARVHAIPDYDLVNKGAMKRYMSPLCDQFLHDLYAR